jgi:serine/threonine protein kinase
LQVSGSRYDIGMNAPDPYRTVSTPAPSAPTPSAPPLPERIGRYRVQSLLGQGGFGLVFLAVDEQLKRRVAIKVPHQKLVNRPEAAEAYLHEARTVAGLDHPHIVPVYDAGSAESFPFFVVSKFVDGGTLANRIKAGPVSLGAALQWVATVAEALHYAHRQGLVHRDVKPGNILLDSARQAHLADFGLALREDRVGHGPIYVGTPAYMSPEQARGEGHRVDGRGDIFSLGVVFYELPVARWPFHGESRDELFEQIATLEPRPPRQRNEAIPREAERICLTRPGRRLRGADGPARLARLRSSTGSVGFAISPPAAFVRRMYHPAGRCRRSGSRKWCKSGFAAPASYWLYWRDVFTWP